MNAPTGGASRSTLTLVEGLTSYGISSAIYCNGTGTEPDARSLTEAVDGRITFGRLAWWNRKIRSSTWKRPVVAARQATLTGFAHRSARNVAAFATSQEADLVHTNTLLTPEGSLAARRLDIPHVWHARELVGPGMPYRFWCESITLPRRVGAHSDVVVANSHVTAEHLGNFIPTSRILVVPNGISDSELETLGPPNAVPPVVGMVADLRSRTKGHQTFLEAAALVRDPEVTFVLFGEDPTPGTDTYVDRLHAEVIRLGLSGRFRFAGRSPDVATNMAMIDILVHPSPHESFGRIVIEAMLAGRPVVGVAAGGVGELVADHETGLCAPRPDPQALADRIDILCADVEQRVAFGQAGRRRAQEFYSAQQMVDGVVAAYRQAVAAHRTRTP